MEKPPSVINIESEQSKEKEKNSRAWETVKVIAVSSMVSMGVWGAEAARELMQPQISNSKVTDNFHEQGKPGETFKQFVSLKVGDNMYRTEVDSGIKKENYTGSGYNQNEKGILHYADSMTSEVDSKDGTKMVVKFKVIPEGMQIHYQQIDSHGRILNEHTSLLTPEKPNILEER